MRRGFKAESERISARFRADLGIGIDAPIDPWFFLKTQGILVLNFYDIAGLSSKSVEQLTVVDPDSWSGLCVQVDNKTGIVLNPAHPKTRQRNTLMHEWSHLFLEHKPKRVDISASGLLLISDYEKSYEDEADWLSGAMLLPRDGLVIHRKRGNSTEEIANCFGLSKELTNWRVRMTGVNRQIKMPR